MKFLRFIHIIIITILELVSYIFALLKQIVNICFTGVIPVEWPEYHVTPIYVSSKTYEENDVYASEYIEQEGYMSSLDYIHQRGRKMWKFKDGVHESYKAIDEDKAN